CNHAARHFTRLHHIEGLVHVIEAKTLRDHLVEQEASVEIEVDVARHVDAEPIAPHHRAHDALALKHNVEAIELEVRANRHHTYQNECAAFVDHAEALGGGLL